MLDPVKFIVYWATSNTEAALRSLGSNEAAKTRVALRLAARGANVRRSSILYALAERALWLEQIGAERNEAVEQLVAEYRLRLEDYMRRVQNAFNTVIFTASMTFLTAIVVLILGVLSPAASAMAYMLAFTGLSIAIVLEGLVPPARRWDYRVTAAAMVPAVAALFWTPAVYLTVPTAVAYGIWYFRLRREAEEELRLAVRGKLQAASTDMAKEALDIVRAVKTSGAYYMQTAAEFLLRMAENFYSSIRTDGLIRGLVVLSLVFVAAAAVRQVYSPLMSMVAAAQQAGSSLPIQLHTFHVKPVMMAFGFVASVLAGRMAESYAMSPVFTPIMLAALLV
ncbi:MAG: hypothetical protein ACP5I3_10395 [Thermoproteus sp.]